MTVTKLIEPVLFCLNLFYKSDTPQGFGIGLTPEYFESNPELMSKIIDLSQMTINYYKTLDTDEERLECVADSWEQLEECREFLVNDRAKHLPNLVSGSETTEFSNESFECLSLALDNITFLESLGLLVSDEYNGVQWTWVGEEQTTNITYH